MYLWLKFFHVLGVVLFLGNIITGAFWHTHALRKGDAALLAHTAEGIVRSDRLFTIPGVLLIIATGIAAALTAGLPILGTGWILWPIVLFTISGVVFMARLGPLQHKMVELAVAADFDLDAYRAVASRWMWWGIVATLAPLAAAVLMVTKPAL